MSNPNLILLTPRTDCRDYMARKGVEEVALLTKQEFDEHCLSGDFISGPYPDSSGDDHGEPDSPLKQVFGQLKFLARYRSNNGRVTFVFAETNPDLDEEVRNHINQRGRIINLTTQVQENKDQEVK